MKTDMKSIYHMYVNQPPDFYARQYAANKGFRSWWFCKRQQTITRFVKKYHSEGPVLDIGCGNCMWAPDGYIAIGVDICHNMLCYNKKHNKYFNAIRADCRISLPIRDESVNTVVITELLEHFPSTISLLSEIRRVLKPGGVVIASVPYGLLPGVWGFIFPLWCLYKGWKDGSQYYKKQCGHVNNFNLKKAHACFNGFTLLESDHILYLTLFLVERKS